MHRQLRHTALPRLSRAPVTPPAVHDLVASHHEILVEARRREARVAGHNVNLLIDVQRGAHDPVLLRQGREPAVVAQRAGSVIGLHLVTCVRSDDKTDYLEPSVPGERLSGSRDGRSVALAAVIRTLGTRKGNTLRVRSGDIVTAEYRQPDGSLRTATVHIRQ